MFVKNIKKMAHSFIGIGIKIKMASGSATREVYRKFCLYFLCGGGGHHSSKDERLPNHDPPLRLIGNLKLLFLLTLLTLLMHL